MNRAVLLAWLGLIPFAAGAVAAWAGIETIDPFGDLVTIVTTYALIIAAFMLGSHWGLYVARGGEGSVDLFTVSNVGAVGLFLAALLLSGPALIYAVCLLFVILLLIDFQIARANYITSSYLALRLKITIIAVISLILVRIAI